MASQAPAPPVIPPRARTRPNGRTPITTNLAHKASSESSVAPSPAASSSPASEEPASTRNTGIDTVDCKATDASTASSISGNGPETPLFAQAGDNLITPRTSNESSDGYFADKRESRASVHEISALTTDLQELGLGKAPVQQVTREVIRQSSTMSLPGTGVRTVTSPRSSSLTATSHYPCPPPRSASSHPESPLIAESVTPPLGSRFKLGSALAPAANITDSAIKMNERKTSANSVNTVGSSSSGGNASFVTADHSRRPSITRISTISAPATAGSGYVSARIARELERQKEVDASRKKRTDTSVGVVVTEDGTVIRDGFKIVDGVAKKSSSSGVYTPPTFRGPSAGVTGTSTGPSPSPYGPASESMFSYNSRSSMSSTRSNSFLAQHLPLRKSDGRKSAFGAALASLTSPLLSPKEFDKEPQTPATPSSASTAESGRMSSDAWRASPLYSPARGQPDRYRSPVAVDNRYRSTVSGGDGHPDRSPLNGVYVNDGGRVVPSPQRMRALSEALNGCTTTDGYGLGYGIQVRDLDATPRSVSESGPQTSRAVHLQHEMENSIPPPQRPRNVKGLSLPLTAAMAANPLRPAAVITPSSTEEATSPQVTSPQSVETPVSGVMTTPGGAAPKMTSASKGIKRKPVPVMGQAV